MTRAAWWALGCLLLAALVVGMVTANYCPGQGYCGP